MRQIKELIVHCADVDSRWSLWDASTQEQMDEITRWHTDPPPDGNGWDANGYHFGIGRTGVIVTGRPIEHVGAHCRRRNAHSIGMVLIGGRKSSANDEFVDHFTFEQDRALRGLIDDLQRRYGPGLKVVGHNDYDSGKACPGFKVGRWLAGKGPRKLAESTTLQAGGVTLAGASAVALPALDLVGGLGDTAQVIAVCGLLAVVCGVAWIARERIARFLRGGK